MSAHLEAEPSVVDALEVIGEAKRRLEERVATGDNESGQHLASLEKIRESELNNEVAALLRDVLDQIDQNGRWRLMGEQPSDLDAQHVEDYRQRWQELTPTSDSDRLVLGYINHLLMRSSSALRWEIRQQAKAAKTKTEAAQDDWLKAA